MFIDERFVDGDIAGIVDGDTMVFDRISSSRAELLAAIRRLTIPMDQANRVAGPFSGVEAMRAALDMLKATSRLFEGLEGLAGAKTVVLVSEGFGIGRNVEGAVRDVVAGAARAGARVYAIDPLGLQRVGGPPSLLNTLSVDTGGLVIFNENNFGRALDAIAADTGVYYLLGVRPLNRRFDGRYRAIDVRVKVPGVSVRARRGYLAVDPSTLRSPWGR
jgi:VWFA-related protein